MERRKQIHWLVRLPTQVTLNPFLPSSSHPSLARKARRRLSRLESSSRTTTSSSTSPSPLTCSEPSKPSGTHWSRPATCTSPLETPGSSTRDTTALSRGSTSSRQSRSSARSRSSSGDDPTTSPLPVRANPLIPILSPSYPIPYYPLSSHPSHPIPPHLISFPYLSLLRVSRGLAYAPPERPEVHPPA